ncbi:MAG: sugar transferase [Candidatus Dormibacterales bacterium]
MGLDKDELGDAPSVHVNWPPTVRLSECKGAHLLARDTLGLAVKRCLDVSLGVVLATLTLPLMLAIGVAIVVDSPGPALFRPTRIGRHGKPFAMLKFRTMVKDAELRLDELSHLNLASGMTKIPDDPRVTRLGKWLRRYSLDELPQILNIVVGQMSLVGPRPHDAHELPNTDLEHDARLSVRPGLTGLWQVNARSDPNLQNRVQLDLQYVSSWSLTLDAKILVKTVPVVILGKGGLVNGALATKRTEREEEILGATAHTHVGTVTSPALNVLNQGVEISAVALAE